MKRLFSWLFVLAILGLQLPARAAAPAVNQTLAADGTWGASRNAMGGETVLCRALLYMPAEGEGVYVCRLSQGLRFGAVTAVEREGEALNAAFYTVVTARQEEAAFTLHVSTSAARPGEALTVEYTLTLTDAAAAENSFSLSPAGESGEPGRVRTFSLTALRAVTLAETGQQSPVADACLTLSRDPGGHDRVAFRRRGEDTYLACAGDTCGHSRHLYVLKTPRSGRVYLQGLSAGTYYLSETRPAEGMTEAAETVELTITTRGEVYTDGARRPDGTAALTHSAGEVPTVKQPLTLLEFYRRGSRVLAAALLALIAARRYYL